VQEEIGLRGAKVAAYHFNPDLAFAIDSTPANDLPVHDGEENTFYNTKLGAGPAIYTFDSGTLSDPRLIRLLAQTGDAEKIPYQYRQPGGGGTDGGAIHRVRAGVPTVSVSVPHRYSHTAISLARIADWENSLALPSAGARDGLTGTLVREALGRVVKMLAGAESDYDRENVRAYLAAMPPGEGFVPLFNGKDLDGWQGLVGNPITRARMPGEERAARQAEADRKARENWSVRDGAIVLNGTGDNLCTVKEYGDFELIVDWRITRGGDSGIYLRGTPQVQIWDPARTDVGAEVGSGGLYNNQKHPSRPLVLADNPVGEWNTFRITMVGETVTVFLNGVKVVDRVIMENYWDRGRPIFERGPIELQAHGTDLAFRDLYVREIAGGESMLSDEERTEGFVALFNGRNLDGWIGNVGGYKVEDGAMVYDPTAGDRTNLYTAKEYADFQLRFEFQLTPGANSGVGIRAPRDGDAAYVGLEIQVLDDSAPIYASLQPYQYHGSVYGIIPARRGFLRPVGEWNREEILVRGSRIRVTLNGAVIVDGDLVEATRHGTMDRQPHPGLERASGHIGWLSHDSVVRFRNVRIRDLSAPVAK
jgi:hypothetical protein